jgi:hypothetical protein
MDGVDDISSLVMQFLPHVSLGTEHILGITAVQVEPLCNLS